MTDLLLPTGCILSGDFNTHQPLWDSRVRSPKHHEALLEIIDNNNLSLINEPDTYIYNYPIGRGRSVLGLAFAFPATIDQVTNWAVMEDPATGSDHEIVSFKLISSAMESVLPPSTERFNCAKAEWPTFHREVLTTSANQSED